MITTEDMIRYVKDHDHDNEMTDALVAKLTTAEHLATFCRGYDFNLPGMRPLLKYVKAYDKAGRVTDDSTASEP